MNRLTLYLKLIIIALFLINYINCHATQPVFFAAGDKPCGDDICMILLTSSDAENWVSVPLTFGARDVVKGKGKGNYLAAGWCRPPLITSDGVNWKEIDIAGDCWNRVSWTNDKYFISGGIGDADDFASLYSSTNGKNFNLVYIKGEAPKITNVVFGNSSYIAVGDGADGSLISYDGKEWNKLPSYDIGALAFNGKQFVAINKEGTVGISGDDYCWKESHVDAIINYLIWVEANHQYVAVGNDGKILTSQDAKQWTQQDSGVSKHLYKVTWTYGLYLAVGEEGTILTSEDGYTWKKQDSHTDYNLLGVA